jgi:hypothetical protein
MMTLTVTRNDKTFQISIDDQSHPTKTLELSIEVLYDLEQILSLMKYDSHLSCVQRRIC